MADKGIIFSAPMVLALLAGRKTQTRRLATSPLRHCQIGDRLWVRETCRAVWHPEDRNSVGYAADDTLIPISHDISLQWDRLWEYGKPPGNGKNVPSIHMPRWASRLTLIVSDVRTEPLLAISCGDAIAEGLTQRQGVLEQWHTWPEPLHQGQWLSPVAAYGWLWDQIHTDPGTRWDDNPEIVAITFEVRHGNIDKAEQNKC